MSDSATGLVGQDALEELTSQEQRELLDAVDKLRRAHISGPTFDLPRIVVCGDQSSGKSSVLEAIAQVRFPIGVGTTTKLASEVVLRNAPSTSTNPIKLRILPAKDRSPATKAHIEAFEAIVDASNPNGYPLAVKQAEGYLKDIEPTRKFWYDRLHVELSGPSQPNLTLVDLPGLIQSEGEGVQKGDKEKIRELVVHHITDPSTIILAIVTAANDTDNQEILQMIRDVKGGADRTFGVLTKPDLAPGSDNEKMAISLVQNEKIPLRLGWHTIRNLRHVERDRSYARRDSEESEFFSKGLWAELQRRNVGISALREKLSRRLLQCIADDLPTFRSNMRQRLTACERLRSDLGSGRDSMELKRAYLMDNQSRLQRLVQAALMSNHQRSDFADFFNGSEARDLRNTINGSTDNFGSKILRDGQQYTIYQDEDDEEDSGSTPTVKPNFHPPYTPTTGLVQPCRITLASYCGALAEHIKHNRGTDLPQLSISNPVSAVFHQQSVLWKPIAQLCADDCCTVVIQFVREAVNYVAGPHTGQKLLRLFDPYFRDLRRRLDAKVDELIWPYVKSHLSTQNPTFAASMQSATVPTVDGEPTESWKRIAKSEGFSSSLVSAADALDSATRYYWLSLNTFVDNITILGIEAVLLKNLTDVFTHEHVSKMQPDVLEDVASEPAGAQAQRVEVNAQITALKDAILTSSRPRVPRDIGNLTDTIPDVTSTSTPRSAQQAGGAPSLFGQSSMFAASPASLTTPSYDTNFSTQGLQSGFGGFGSAPPRPNGQSARNIFGGPSTTRA
ncbi:hypothetical protein B0A48_08800 [Cryoendolithus antarcticus]|uniref:GED domain-containing protein n=1 Tax=Cryoendolithus antarcticus TaxID=1507870 RepID=A0A1V8T4X3_9PEZI|nr:hypothetical protein B0A48_08800 [Cryoendolithus antarcticus]